MLTDTLRYIIHYFDVKKYLKINDLSFIHERVRGKGKVVPVHFMNVCKESGGIAPLILNLCTKWS